MDWGHVCLKRSTLLLTVLKADVYSGEAETLKWSNLIVVITIDNLFSFVQEFKRMHWAKYHPVNFVQSLCGGLAHS